MKHTAILPCISTLVLIILIAICFAWKNSEQYSTYDKSTEDTLRNRANVENTWIISHQNAVRKGTYTQIDATDRYLYFSYSKSSCVDVFNHNGEFQYAILLPDCQNGTVQIRCVDNCLFVSDKNNTVYIFDENEEIERMNYDQAKLRGYDFFWFEEKKSIQKVDEFFYYEMDDTGNAVRKILLPTENTSINYFPITIFLIALLLYFLAILRYFQKKTSLQNDVWTNRRSDV